MSVGHFHIIVIQIIFLKCMLVYLRVCPFTMQFAVFDSFFFFFLFTFSLSIFHLKVSQFAVSLNSSVQIVTLVAYLLNGCVMVWTIVAIELMKQAAVSYICTRHVIVM